MAVTATDIRAIMDTSLQDSEIEVYIPMSETILNSILSGYTIDDSVMDLLITWVTAHLISISKDRQAQQEKAGTASITYTGKYEMNFTMTSYGQMAITLDPTGELANAHKMKASVTAVKSFKCTRRRHQ